jgi:hypothetical protein
MYLSMALALLAAIFFGFAFFIAYLYRNSFSR